MLQSEAKPLSSQHIVCRTGAAPEMPRAERLRASRACFTPVLTGPSPRDAYKKGTTYMMMFLYVQR